MLHVPYICRVLFFFKLMCPHVGLCRVRLTYRCPCLLAAVKTLSVGHGGTFQDLDADMRAHHLHMDVAILN